jgi:hypothetical protein
LRHGFEVLSPFGLPRMTYFPRSTSRGVEAASETASETRKMSLRTADETSDSELGDGRPYQSPYVPSRSNKRTLGSCPVYYALLQPSFGQGSRGYQFNDLTTKPIRALYCISKFPKRVYHDKTPWKLGRHRSQKCHHSKKKIVSFSGSLLPHDHPFLCPVLIRDPTVCMRHMVR